MSDEERKTEFNFPLPVPFNFASDGQQANAEFITFYAPSAKVSKECAFLKQAFFRASQQQPDVEDSGNTNQEIFGHDIITMIAISNVDLSEVIDSGKRLLISPGIAKVNGEKTFRQKHIDDMDAEDLENAIGEYLVNFTLASSLKRIKEISNDGSQI